MSESGTTAAGTAGTDGGGTPAKPDRSALWKRGGFVLLFMVAFELARWALYLTAVIQFASQAITGRPNEFLVDFGRSLAIWMAEVSAFLASATERRPFPFSPWPRAD